MARISVELLGLHFRNPILPAAGPNVGNGEQLRRAAEGGAGGLLAKTVSVRAAEVPRPDMVRSGRFGMLNTELWTELPLEAWLEREYDIGLEAARRHGIPFLASMGYTPDDLRRIGPMVEAKGVDAIEFSIHYLDPARLVETARALRESVRIPIVAKLSPHKGDLGELAAAIEPYVDAFACINSYGPALQIDVERAEPVLGSTYGYGWLSGPALRPLALRSVVEVARRVSKPVIGIGGITTARDVIAFLMAGASLVEVCTAILFRGQGYFAKLARGVSDWLDAHGYDDIARVRGLALASQGGRPAASQVRLAAPSRPQHPGAATPPDEPPKPPMGREALEVEVLGLRFRHPVLAGPGPQVDGAEGLVAAMDGGAGGVVTRTIVAGRLPGLGGALGEQVPDAMARFGTDGLLSTGGSLAAGPSRIPAGRWIEEELPRAAAVARARGVPLVASVAGPAGVLRELAPRLVRAGAQALELVTPWLAWDEAVAAARALRESAAVAVIARLGLSHGEDVARQAAELEPWVDAFTCMHLFGPVLEIDVESGGAPVPGAEVAGGEGAGGSAGFGWLSGGPIHPVAVRAVFEVARSSRKPVIASGGASSVRDVVEFLQVGASLVQVTTAALLKGPPVYGELGDGLGEWLRLRGLASVEDIRGAYVRRWGGGQRVVTAAEESPVLDEGRCIRCGACEPVCFYDALSAPKRALPVIDPARCFQCGLCVSVCPTGALSFRPRTEATLLRPA